MPLYDYKCDDCKNIFTALQKHDEPNPPCPSCGSPNTTKQVSSPSGFEFKGSGFYVTDFKNK